MTIEVVKSESGGWFWRLLGKNGRVLATSEIYSRKEGALKTAGQVGHRARVRVIVRPLLQAAGAIEV